MRKTLLCIILSVAAISLSHAQKVAIKSNLLYDATTTMNLAAEVGLGVRTTLDISGSYNPWEFSNNRTMKLYLIQPEFRLWTCERFNGHFFGVHAHFAEFNFMKIKQFGLSNKKYEGHLYGAGLSYGYHWILGNRWGLEATMGLGYARIEYNKNERTDAGCTFNKGHKDYFGPTKVGISVIFMIK